MNRTLIKPGDIIGPAERSEDAFSRHFQTGSFLSRIGFEEAAHAEKWKAIDAWHKIRARR